MEKHLLNAVFFFKSIYSQVNLRSESSKHLLKAFSWTSIISGFQALSLHKRESRDQRDQRVYPPHISQLSSYFRKQVQELGNSGRAPLPNPRICTSCCLLRAVEVKNTSTSYSSLEETTTFTLRIVPCLVKR